MLHWLCYSNGDLLLFCARTFGQLSVSADNKWVDIYRHCYLLLGCSDEVIVETDKAWEAVAVMVTNSKKAMKGKIKRFVHSIKHICFSVQISAQEKNSCKV